MLRTKASPIPKPSSERLVESFTWVNRLLRDLPAKLDRLPKFGYYAKLRVHCKEIGFF